MKPWLQQLLNAGFEDGEHSVFRTTPTRVQAVREHSEFLNRKVLAFNCGVHEKDARYLVTGLWDGMEYTGFMEAENQHGEMTHTRIHGTARSILEVLGEVHALASDYYAE